MIAGFCGLAIVRRGAPTVAVLFAAPFALVVALGANPTLAADPKPAQSKSSAPPVKNMQILAPTAPPPREGALAEQYCRAIRDAGADARFAVQAARLKALGKQLEERLALVEAKAAELKEWFARREEFSQKATAQLVNIYGSMRPEAASEQLTRMDEITAAAILGKLESRTASAILNDMPAEKAARLATILAGASRKSEPGDKS